MKAAVTIRSPRRRRRVRRANITVAEFVEIVATALTAKAEPEVLAARLMREMNGRRVPRFTTQRVSRETRDAAIKADLDAGRTYAETAARHGVSEYTVWRASQRAQLSGLGH